MSERKLFAHELEARLDELLLLSLRQRSAEEPAALLEALPRELQDRVLHWAGVAAQTSDDLGWLIASLAGGAGRQASGRNSTTGCAPGSTPTIAAASPPRARS
jgi:hypothetical protein